MEQLQSIPNGRDMWALLAVTPSVMMGRIDVGGNRAGTQTGYSAYGQTGQVRVLIEGINTTEGHGRRRLLLRLRVARRGVSRHHRPVGRDAERPACRASSSRDRAATSFRASITLDWYNNALQGSNIPDDYTAATAFNNSPIRAHSNEIDRYYDHDINGGGPIKKDRAWVFGTYRAAVQRRRAAELPVRQDLRHEALESGRQGHLSAQSEEQADRLLPVGTERAAESPAVCDLHLCVAGTDVQAGLRQLGLQGRVERHAQRQALRRGALWRLRVLLPALHQQPRQLLLARHAAAWSRRARTRSSSSIATASSTPAPRPISSTPPRGSHTIKLGGGVPAGAVVGRLRVAPRRHQQHRADLQQRRLHAGDLRDPDGVVPGRLTRGARLPRVECRARSGRRFVTDTWAIGRTTLNAGVRYDRYHAWLPEQEQLAGTVGPVTVPAKQFAGDPLLHLELVCAAHRRRLRPDRQRPDGAEGQLRSLLAQSGSGDRRQRQSEHRQQVRDLHVGRRQRSIAAGSRAKRRCARRPSLDGNLTIDPNITNPYTHEASVWIERQLTDTMGARAGFVYKTEDDLIATFQPGRPPSAFTVPYAFNDNGVDGRAGTADDRPLTFYGMPNARPPAVSRSPRRR